MKECLECGYTGSSRGFEKGCSMCGNWDSFNTENLGIEQGSEEDFENQRRLNDWDDEQAEAIWNEHYRYR